MARLSWLDKQPQEVRDLVNRLRRDGATIDTIFDELFDRGVIVARSTLGRETKKIDEVCDYVRRSQGAADAIMAPLAEAGEDRQMRALTAMLQSILFDVVASRAATGDQTETFDGKEFAFLCRGLKDLGQARKMDADYLEQIRRQAALKATEAAATAAETAARARGVSEEGIEALTAAILQVTPESLRTRAEADVER